MKVVSWACALLFLLVTGNAMALQLAVRASPDSIRSGEQVTIQATLTNDSGVSVSGLVLQVRVPNDVFNFNQQYLSHAGTCPSSVCTTGEYASWALETLAPGQGITVSMTARLGNGVAPGTLISTSARALFSAVELASSSASVVVDNDNALTLAAEEDRDAAVPGERLVYSLSYGNRSINAVTGAVMSLPLPSGVTFVSASGGGGLVGGGVQWNLGSIPGNQTGRQQVVVSVNAGTSAGTILQTEASLGGVSSTGTKSARAVASTRVQNNPPLQVAVEMTPDAARSGEQVTARVTVSNRGTSPLTGVQLQLRVPEEVFNFNQEYLSGGGTCTSNVCVTGELATWAIGTLQPGQGVTVSMLTLLGNGIQSGHLLQAEALARADGGNHATATRAIVVDNDNALTLAVEDDRDAAVPGERLVYSMSYGNRSISPVTGAVLSLPLPAGVTFVSASGGGTVAGGSVQWNIGSIPGNQTGRQQVIVNVNAGTGAGTILQTDASLSGASVNGIESGRAVASTRVQSNPPLQVAVEMTPDALRSGEQVTARVTVSNRGTSPLTGVQLQLRVPEEVFNFNQEYLSSGGTCTSNICVTGELATWAIGTLQPGQGVTVSMLALLGNGIQSGHLLRAEALVRADGGQHAAATRGIVVDNDNALTLAVEDDRDAAVPGERLVYSLSYGNRSISPVTGAVLSLPLPAGVTFVSATGGGSVAGGSVQWNIGSIPGSQTGRQQVIVNVNAGTGAGTILQTDASLSGVSVNGIESGRAVASTRVQNNPPLQVAVEMTPDAVRSGEQVTARVTVSNRGTTNLTGVQLQLRVSEEVFNFNQEYLSSGGTCTSNVCVTGELATWAIGTLQPGQGVTVSMLARLGNGIQSGHLLRAEALVHADGGQHATATRAIVIDNDNALTLAVEDDRDAAAPGAVVNYTLRYGNRFPTAVTGTQLRFPIPAGTSVVSSTGGTVSAEAVTWNLGTVDGWSGGRRQVALRINAATPSGALLQVTDATVTGDSVSGREQAGATLTTSVRAEPRLRIAVTSTPDPITSGQVLNTTIRLTNDWTFDLFNVRLEVRVPEEVFSFNQSALGGGGTCSSSVCVTGEIATWIIPQLSAGQTVTVTMPATLGNGVGAGKLLRIDASARADTGEASSNSNNILVVGTAALVDTDGDGIANIFDNCIQVANPNQRDTNGDGYGNVCDADLDNNGFVNFIDLGRFNAAFGTTNADANLDGVGVVNFIDLGIFNRQFGRAPGPSALAP